MSWESRTPAARPGPQAAGEEPGVTVDHQPQLSWPGLPLGLGRAGILAAGGQAPATPHRPSGEPGVLPGPEPEEQGAVRSEAGIPAPAEEGRPQPRARRVGILLKPGVHRAVCVLIVKTTPRGLGRHPSQARWAVTSHLPPQSRESWTRHSAPVTAGEPPLLRRAPAWVVFHERGPFQAGWGGVGWTPSPPAQVPQ